MPDLHQPQTFLADGSARRAGTLQRLRRNALVLAGVLALLIAAIFLLQSAIAAILVAVTVLVAVPLALRYARLEDTALVDVAADSVVFRRGTASATTVDRHAVSYDVVVFTDRYEITTQLLITDGSNHIRLVSGSWTPETLVALASTAARSPREATWKEIKANHPESLRFWERHTTAIIASVVLGIPALIIFGAVLTVLLFDVG